MTDIVDSDFWIAPPFGFVCPGCGRSLIGVGMIRMEPPLCGACLTHPGWYQYPDAVAQLDPINQRDRNAITLSLSEIECRSLWLKATRAWLNQRLVVEDSVHDHLEQQWVH